MILTFVQLAGFVSDWKHYRLNDTDLRALESLLLARPHAGAVMAGAGGLRKIRFSPPSRHSGKSGAYRIAYAWYHDAGAVLLLAVFAKNEQANLTAAEKARFRAVIASFRPR